MTKGEPKQPRPHDPREQEVERLLRPQPPQPVPTRGSAPAQSGYVAYQLLGHRIITRAGTL